MSKEKFIKKLLEASNVTDEYTREQVEAGVTSYFCANVDEKYPEFQKAPCETLVSGVNNSQIVLGRDRNAGFLSGVAGRGGLQCGMIDLVAGRGHIIMEHNKKNNTADPLEGIPLVGPMFHSDAARIYITQRCENIDRYFGLKPSGGVPCSGKSAVAMKADQVRIVAREKVRIFAGRGNWEGFDPNIGETNCLGQRLKGQVIELQVGNLPITPAVLGNKLVQYLKKKNKKQRELHNMLFTINNNLALLNSIVSTLPGAAIGLGPFVKSSIENSTASITQALNTYLDQMDAIDNDLIPGANHILSNAVYIT